MRALANEWKSQGKRVALVPTQGALHAGQESLIRAALAQADIVVVTLFVNALQFGPSEVSANYPRRPAEDLALCEAAGVHVVFTPAPEEIYPRGYSTFVAEEWLSRSLDGVSRPTHFRGITTLMVKLFVVVQPTLVFFGQKTAQRAAVVRKMSVDLGFEVEVVVVPTEREADGLAVGICNSDFSPTLRQEALSISRALMKGKSMSESGVRSPDRVIAEATHLLGQNRRVRIIYVAIVDGATMETVREITPGRSMLAIAAWIDEVRVGDNVVL